jgi:putative DNA primase/helicase
MSAAVDRVLDALHACGCSPRPDGTGWTFKCPAHEDHKPSAHLSEGDDGRALLYCFKRCTHAEIATRLGLAVADLSDAASTSRPQTRARKERKRVDSIPSSCNGAPAIARYEYSVDDGAGKAIKVRYQKQGSSDKTFLVYEVDPAGGFWVGLGGRKLDVYAPVHMPPLGDRGDYLVILSEGEKAADACARHLEGYAELAGRYIAAGTHGATSFRGADGARLVRELEGFKDLIVVVDRDQDGERWAEDFRRHAEARLAKLRFVQSAVTTPKADLADHLAAGRSIEQLVPFGAATSTDPPGAARPARAPAYVQSDAGNADRFVDEHAGNVLHVPGIGWYVWTGAHWREDDSEMVTQLACRTMRRQFDEAIASTDQHRSKRIAFALKSENSQRIRGALELARSHPKIVIPVAKLDADPWALNVANGTLDLRTARLRPHRREDLLTHFVDVPYDPKATARRWRSFIEEVLRVEVAGRFDEAASAELRTYVQRVAGYCLTGSIQEQCVFLLYGGGSNGKSAWLTVFMALVGGLAKVIDIRALLFNRNDNRSAAGPSDHLARLRGARIVKAQEVEAGRRFDEAQLKDLTGGESITARSMYKAGVDFTPTFKIVIAANHRPHVHGTDHGIWRRMRCIPFTVDIPDEKQDKTLAETIIATELPGVLAWAVEGCKQWRANGLGSALAVEIETLQYRETEDIVGQFLEERCTLSADGWTPTGMLHAAYAEWAKQTGHVELTARALSERLGGRPGIASKRAPGARGWAGISLVAEPRLLREMTQ